MTLVLPELAVGAAALIVASMQFSLELKVYFAERRRKKQEAQQPSNQHIVQYYPAPIIVYVYTICSMCPAQPSTPYNYIYHHAPYDMAQFPPHGAYPLPPPMSHPPHNPATASSTPRSMHKKFWALSRLNGKTSPSPSFFRAMYHRMVGKMLRKMVSLSQKGKCPKRLVGSSHASLSSTISASTPSYDRVGLLDGHMELHIHQQAPLIRDARYVYGMRTGACAHNDRVSSYNHWKSLLEFESTHNIQSSIAVVDWSRRNIDMFMEIGGAYFRNYRVSRCNVDMFADLFKEREVFSGEIKQQKLKRFSKEMKMVDMRGEGMQSTNSWRSCLGIDDESEDMQEVVRERASFLRTIRGAVFGLVCSLYEAPSDFNVDMERTAAASGLDIVRISTHRPLGSIVKRDSCIFSVFSFCDHGWAAQAVLLG